MIMETGSCSFLLSFDGDHTSLLKVLVFINFCQYIFLFYLKVLPAAITFFSVHCLPMSSDVSRFTPIATTNTSFVLVFFQLFSTMTDLYGECLTIKTNASLMFREAYLSFVLLDESHWDDVLACFMLLKCVDRQCNDCILCKADPGRHQYLHGHRLT